MKALLCLVSESMYLPVRVEDDEPAADVDAAGVAVAASTPFGVALEADGRDLAAFVGVFLEDALVPLGKADVDALAEVSFAAAIVSSEQPEMRYQEQSCRGDGAVR